MPPLLYFCLYNLGEIMEHIEFTGYEPKPIMAQKMAALVKEVKELRDEVEKLKSAAEPVKKSTKATKAEE